MKKIAVSLIGVTLCLQGFAQSGKISSAATHLDYYRSHRDDTTELASGRAAIDEAAINEKTKDEPKMHLYRGEIYLEWFNMHLNKLESKLLPAGATDNKSKNKAYADAFTQMDTSSICIATNSFIKVIQLVPKDYYAKEALSNENLPKCLLILENKALVEFNNKHYPSALALYKKAISVCPVLNITDTAKTYKENIEMAAFSADRAGNNAEAIIYYQKTMDLKYDKSTPYRLLSALYLKQNDSTKAWGVIEKGRTDYPDDEQIIILETNYFINRHDFAKAESNLKLTISKVEASPNKDSKVLTSLYTNLGNIYDRRANPKGVTGDDTTKPADYETLFGNAETYYKKALELDPANFDVLFVTGALYYNRAVSIAKDADKLPLNATEKYNKLIADSKGYFAKAQPYFESAHKVKPDDVSNTNALKQVYSSTGQNDKAEGLK